MAVFCAFQFAKIFGADNFLINRYFKAIMLGTAVSIAGYGALAWIIYKTAYTLYCIVYPHLIATPRDLKKLAGARWAGQCNLSIIFVSLVSRKMIWKVNQCLNYLHR